MPWIDVTDPANWTAQRVVYDDPTPLSCLPLSYSEDGTDLWSWSGSEWTLPTLTVTSNSSWANVPTLRYVGVIDPATISGLRVTGTMVGNHTVGSVDQCMHIAIAFNIHNWISDDDPPQYPDDCGVSGAVLNNGDTVSNGELFILESTGSDGDYTIWLENVTALAMEYDSDFCGPHFVQDTVPASFGLTITKIEVLAPGVSVFWQDFLGCEEDA